jgi:hypothetical protein
MLIYREQVRKIRVSDVFLTQKNALFDVHKHDLDALHALLIEAGELEAACPALRAPTLAAARALVCAWHGEPPQPETLEVPNDLPDVAEVPVSEGFAFYSLYPETYLAAAAAFFRDYRPRQATVIGIRSIGCALSAVVTAELERLGCKINSLTVRPTGHPFDRATTLPPEITPAGAPFLIVDEGPGISGSTFASVAEALAQRGVPDRGIVLFPSWDCDGSSLLSEKARARWPKHRKYVGSFEETWLTSGRLGLHAAADLSAGAWRRLVYREGDGAAPEVQPQHEARKYLGAGPQGEAMLWKFAGLGRYGQQRLEHAQVLAESGLVENGFALRHGFLSSHFVPGRPLWRRPAESEPGLVDALAAYVAHRANRLPAEVGCNADALLHMVETNVRELLGPQWLAPLAGLGGFRKVLESAPAVYCDGRMLPHEWIATAQGYRKVDALDHGDNHFFPGPVDAAWDVAGALTEFSLDTAARHRLLDQYQVRTGDRGIRRRLPFFTVAYLAFRAAITHMNAGSAAVPEGDRRGFEKQAARYRASLEREILRFALESKVPA